MTSTRCPAMAYTNDPARLWIQCTLPAGHARSHKSGGLEQERREYGYVDGPLEGPERITRLTGHPRNCP